MKKLILFFFLVFTAVQLSFAEAWIKAEDGKWYYHEGTSCVDIGLATDTTQCRDVAIPPAGVSIGGNVDDAEIRRNGTKYELWIFVDGVWIYLADVPQGHQADPSEIFVTVES